MLFRINHALYQDQDHDMLVFSNPHEQDMQEHVLRYLINRIH